MKFVFSYLLRSTTGGTVSSSSFGLVTPKGVRRGHVENRSTYEEAVKGARIYIENRFLGMVLVQYSDIRLELIETLEKPRELR